MSKYQSSKSHRHGISLTEIYAHAERGDDEVAAELVFDEIDDLPTAGDLHGCNELLYTVDVERLNSNLLISFLAATFTVKDLLSGRACLLRRVEARLQQLAPDRVEALMRAMR